MALLNLSAARQLIRELGGQSMEVKFQHVWYCRGLFKWKDVDVYGDFTLVGKTAVASDELIIGSKYLGSASEFSAEADAAKREAIARYRNHTTALQLSLAHQHGVTGLAVAELDVLESLDLPADLALHHVQHQVKPPGRTAFTVKNWYLSRSGRIYGLPKV